MANVWQKAFNRIFWRNRDKGAPYTPLGESKLLPMDASIDEMDDRILNLNTTKADQSDFLTSLKNITYNSATGVFTITKFNDSTFTIDTDLEKIAVNFDYDDDPTSAHYQNLIITLDDGTVKYVDLSALITEYEFGNTTTINFTVSSSTGIVTANLINGSVTSDHLSPSVMADINAAVESAEGHAEDAEAWAVGQRDGSDVSSSDPTYHNNSKYYSEVSEDKAEDSEAYAIGKRGGTDVPQSDPAYHNNSKYYAEQAEATLSNTVRSFNGRKGAVVPTAGDYNINDLGDVNITSPTDGQGLRYDNQSGKWVNGDAASAVSNLTDVALSNLANGEILKYNSTTHKWENSQDSGGHTIQDESGTNLTPRSTMQFTGDLTAEDDITNSKTVIGVNNGNAYATIDAASVTGHYNLSSAGYKLAKGYIYVYCFYDVFCDNGSLYFNINNQGDKPVAISRQLSGHTLAFKAGATVLFFYNGMGYMQVPNGHMAQNSSGNTLPYRPTIQFKDAFLTNDSTNDKTVVENIKPVTRAQFDVATEDGFYGITDEDDATIEPASEDYVEVEASSDTMGSLISKLFLEVDWDKVTDYAYLTLSDTGIAYYLASLDRIDRNNDNAIFTRANVSSGGARVYYFYLASSGQYYIAKGATAEEDHSSDNVPNGTVLALHYGTSSSVTNLINQAKYTYLESGESVEQAMYVQSHGSQTVIEQSSWDTTTGDTTVTATHTGYLVGTFNVHSCNGGGAYTHGVIVFIDSIPVANIYSQGDSTAEANSGSFCIPIKKGQVVIVRVNNGTWLGKAYIRY